MRLADQDRGRWDDELVVEADRLVVEALQGGPPGRFALQAAIACLHARAPSYEETDWPQVVVLYDRLERIWPSPVVALNRAVAVAEVDGPAQALHLVDALEQDGRLDRYPYLPATRGELLARMGRRAEAVEAFRRAHALTDNDAERAHLEARIAHQAEGEASEERHR